MVVGGVVLPKPNVILRKAVEKRMNIGTALLTERLGTGWEPLQTMEKSEEDLGEKPDFTDTDSRCKGRQKLQSAKSRPTEEPPGEKASRLRESEDRTRGSST